MDILLPPLESQNARVFNRGSDARLRGLPLSANPYGRVSKDAEVWRQGWESVDRHWGTDVRGRWSYVELMPVRWS